MTARTRPTRRRAGFGLLVAAFVVICGVVLVLVPPGRIGARASDPHTDLVTQALNSLDLAQQAEQALDDANYGEVRQQLQSTEASLRQLVAALRHSRN